MSMFVFCLLFCAPSQRATLACALFPSTTLCRSGLFEPPHRLDSASWVGSRLAEILPLPLAAKQELLELGDARTRLERLNALLAH
jgi:hypothetical protein